MSWKSMRNVGVAWGLLLLLTAASYAGELYGAPAIPQAAQAVLPGPPLSSNRVREIRGRIRQGSG